MHFSQLNQQANVLDEDAKDQSKVRETLERLRQQGIHRCSLFYIGVSPKKGLRNTFRVSSHFLVPNKLFFGSSSLPWQSLLPSSMEQQSSTK